MRNRAYVYNKHYSSTLMLEKNRFNIKYSLEKLEDKTKLWGRLALLKKKKKKTGIGEKNFEYI